MIYVTLNVIYCLILTSDISVNYVHIFKLNKIIIIYYYYHYYYYYGFLQGRSTVTLPEIRLYFRFA